MITIREYGKAESLEQAYEWNQKKNSRIMGGMMWMRLGHGNVGRVIDLSGLGLDKIEETEEEISIGAMVSLRQLEQHPGLNTYTDGAARESVRHIVGVQFRNTATVGGSIFGRFGFSDVLTLFLGLDSYVELYKEGILSMEEFAAKKPDNDILVRVIVKKKPLRIAYLSQRNTKTDFPVLACAVSQVDGEWRAVIGARPGRAVVVREEVQNLGENPSETQMRAFAEYVKNHVKMGSNMRGSAEYRSILCEVLVRRALEQIGGTDEDTVHA